MRVFFVLMFACVIALGCKTKNSQSQVKEGFINMNPGVNVGEKCTVGTEDSGCKNGLECVAAPGTRGGSGICGDPNANLGELGGQCGGFAGTMCKEGLGCIYPSGMDKVNDGWGVCAQKKSFIALGEAGRSGRFNNVLTVYVNAEDSQPRCIGCKSFRVIFDSMSQNGPVGNTFSTKVGANLSKICDKAGKPKLIDLTSIWRDHYSPSTATLTVEVNPSLCKGDTFAIEFYGMKCLNPTVPECEKMVVHESFDVSMKEIGGLPPIDVTGDLLLPNRNIKPSTASSNDRVTPALGEEGGACGGLGGFKCKNGLLCDTSDVPEGMRDGQGICKRPLPGEEGGLCAGIGGIECQEGLDCDMSGVPEDMRDGAGKCVKR